MQESRYLPAARAIGKYPAYTSPLWSGARSRCGTALQAALFKPVLASQNATLPDTLPLLIPAHFFRGIERHRRSRTPFLVLAVRTHLAGRRDQMLLRLAYGVAPRPPLPANVPPLARAYTLAMADRAQDGEHQALGELSSSSRSFNWGGDTAELEEHGLISECEVREFDKLSSEFGAHYFFSNPEAEDELF